MTGHVILLSVFLLMTSCQGQLDSRTIMTYLQDEGLTTLSGFIFGTGLDGLLSNPNAPAMTLFAPTEDAWKKLASNELVGLATNSTALKFVLQGHLVDQVVLSQYVRDQDTKTNFQGEQVRFRVYPNGVKTVNGAQLIGKDISLANGVVHMIDDIILPTEYNVGEYIAQRDSDFKDLFGLLVLGRLFGVLETGGPFTLFAPVDSAFDAIQSTLTSLVSDRDALAKVLKHHVVADDWWSVGLTDGMVLTTLDGGNLTVAIDSTGVRVGGATVTEADIATSNGVVHVIDTVL